jgi:hypothetical protein
MEKKEKGERTKRRMEDRKRHCGIIILRNCLEKLASLRRGFWNPRWENSVSGLKQYLPSWLLEKPSRLFTCRKLAHDPGRIGISLDSSSAVEKFWFSCGTWEGSVGRFSLELGASYSCCCVWFSKGRVCTLPYRGIHCGVVELGWWLLLGVFML